MNSLKIGLRSLRRGLDPARLMIFLISGVAIFQAAMAALAWLGLR